MAKHLQSRRESRSGAYKTWAAMWARIRKPNRATYRNISVCTKWKKFENFYSDLGPRPPNHTLERIDNSGDYCPENCKWIPASQQSRNTSRTRRITFNGSTRILEDWAKELGITPGALHYRLKKMPLRTALTKEKHGDGTHRLVTHNGKTLILKEWASRLGIKQASLSSRLARGWSIERALSTGKQS